MTPTHAALLIIVSATVLINYRILFPSHAPFRALRRRRNGEYGKVVAIVDGDTIKVDVGTEIQSVRYIGINAPERGQAGYDEATRRNRHLVLDKWVRLEADKRDEDKYGRKLRYVWTGRTFVNRALYQHGVEIMRVEPNTRRIREIEA